MRRDGFIRIIFFFSAIYPGNTSPLIRLKKHSDEFDSPVGISVIKEDSSRIFVVERGGLIKIVLHDGKKTNGTPFLDASSLLGSSGGERGLLGLAFHPNYVTNGKFFINYTQDKSGVISTVVSQFLVDDSDPDVANPDSETVIIRFNQPFRNHNGGDIKFGPDGYLYIASGDGGSGGDPIGNGQNLSTMLGKILRIDVDTTSGEQNYAVPPDNPFAPPDAPANGEIWAYGLRNPWRISFDMEEGDLYIADVGQKLWEEVNFQAASSVGGENYGWNGMEGFHCYEAGCDVNDDSFTLPILEYGHKNSACSITGGYVHRGKNKFLNGRYFYGDYCNGNIWATRWVNNKWKVKLMYENTGLFISTFGQDASGNVYVVGMSSGSIYQITRCKDNTKYKLEIPDGRKISCRYISRKQNRIDRHCVKEKVKDRCAQTCGNCGP